MVGESWSGHRASDGTFMSGDTRSQGHSSLAGAKNKGQINRADR
jgi:hypothetical protein